MLGMDSRAIKEVKLAGHGNSLDVRGEVEGGAKVPSSRAWVGLPLDK